MRRPWREPSLERAPGFDGFARTRLPGLLSMARGLTGSNVEAEELVQHVLAKALYKWDTVSRADDPDVYVKRMLVEAATSFRRRVFHRSMSADSALLRALATLKPKYRVVMVLRYHEGMNDHEIAATLGMTLSSVRGNAVRGLAGLRKAGLLNEARV